MSQEVKIIIVCHENLQFRNMRGLIWRGETPASLVLKKHIVCCPMPNFMELRSYGQQKHPNPHRKSEPVIKKSWLPFNQNHPHSIILHSSFIQHSPIIWLVVEQPICKYGRQIVNPPQF